MAKKIIICLIHLLLQLHSSRAFSEADGFIFNGFRGAESKMILDGVAKIEQSGVLKLTGEDRRTVGRAFYHTPIKFKNSSNGKTFSFSTAFSFGIVPEYAKLGGHGFAFTVSNSKVLNGAFPSQFLGLVNTTDFGKISNPFFAVEFDTVKNILLEDINDNHVGLDFNSLVSNVSVDASCFNLGNSRKEELNLHTVKMIQAWIDYDSIEGKLDVTLSHSSSKPNSSVLSFPVDLSPFFMDYMHVGFSASTGVLASSHYISGWSFMMNGEAQTLDLSLLPSIPGLRRNHLSLIVGACLSAAALLILAIGMSLYVVRKIKNKDVIESWELEIGPHRFSYDELSKATRGFRDEELLGFGGFGRVYKGTLPNSNTQVAVKRINHESKQGLQDFVTELVSIGRLRHRHLVLLLGWSRHRGDLLLVYDLMPNGSLDKYIYDDPRIVLTWKQRFNIIKGVACALLYLHEECEQTVIHRDIKAANVMLDSDMNSRLGDFGLAKFYECGASPSTTKVVGTLGYLAPELTKTGKPTTSTDVFAFGALLLEVVCGRRPIEVKAMPEELVLVDWVWDKWKQGSILEVVDSRLKGEYNEAEAVTIIKLGLLCSDNAPQKRPNIRQVVRCLEGEAPPPQVLAAPDEHVGGKDRISPGMDFPQSYTSSSNCEKLSVWSSGCDGEGGVDLEPAFSSPLSAL